MREHPKQKFCLHNICVYFTVYIYYAFTKTHIYSIVMYYKIHKYMYLFIFVLYLIYKQNIYLKYIHACGCLYIYIINKHSTHAYIM